MPMFTSLEFILSLVLALAILTLARQLKSLKFFNAVLLVINLCFMWLIADVDWHVGAALLSVGGLAFIAAKLLVLKPQAPQRRKNLIYYFALGFVLLVFAVAKYPILTACVPLQIFADGFAKIFQLKQPLALIGISYFAFKAIQVLVDSYQGVITKIDLLTFLNFIFFFPVYLSGPIERYQIYDEKTELAQKVSVTAIPWADAVARFASGLIKKLVIASIFMSYSIVQVRPEQLPQQSRFSLLLAAASYTFYIFFDFSGYCDLAIATGQMMGFEIPENFLFPFISLSIREYWNRWHITLSEWIRDFLFYPMLRALLTCFPNGNSLFLSALSVALAFTICGVWHGGAWHYFLHGLGHGLALATYMIYSDIMKKRYKKKYQAMKQNVFYKSASWALTMGFVFLNNVLFYENGPQILWKILTGQG